MNSKKVSVIIPTYKRSEMLGRAINSVLDQSYKNIEVIVVDDNDEGSSFRLATMNFMKKYENEKKIIYLKHSKNKNGSAARNTGIRYSNASYIAFLDDDDFWFPTKIEKQVNQMENLDDCYGGISCFHVRRYKKWAYAEIKFQPKESGNYVAEFLSNKLSMPSSTLLLRRSIFNKVGLFDESFTRHQDLEFLIRYFRNYKLDVVEETLTVMQTEGFRNYPSGDEAKRIKLMFFGTFKIDFSKLSKSELKDINHYHWLGVASFYFKEMKIQEGKLIYNEYVRSNSNSLLRDILHSSFFLIGSVFPQIKMIYCFLIAVLKLKSYSFNNL